MTDLFKTGTLLGIGNERHADENTSLRSPPVYPSSEQSIDLVRVMRIGRR